MHSMMEGDSGSEPQDVFVELGTLIVEGRVPGGAGVRGYTEGPHCSSLSPNNASHRHLCNPQQNFLCKRAESFRKHMLLLFQNNVPMCIEVLLCPDCVCGAQKTQSSEVGIIPSSSDLLLEQWTITVVNRQNEPSPMLARGLVQAVRSQLHFSQLSAWWSSSSGVRPCHVSYRVTLPGQAFASQFMRPPNEHTFPVAAVGKGSAIRVCARSLPRMDTLPRVACPLHKGLGESDGSNSNGMTLEVAGLGAGDSLLGESLLDLQLPQRLRSPPRAAEAPDHMLFRRLPSDAVGARWQGDSSPSPPLGLSGRRRLENASVGEQSVSVTGTGTAGSGSGTGSGAVGALRHGRSHRESDNSCRFSGVVDDRMKMECNTPGKHHCSCEGEEEEVVEVAVPVPRQRRRSQASLPPQMQPPAMAMAAPPPAPAATPVPAPEMLSVANESTKRSSGSAVIGEQFLYTSEGACNSTSSSTGSLKRRRPVVEKPEPSCSTLPWELGLGLGAERVDRDVVGDKDRDAALDRTATPPIQLKPPLSRRELEEVLAVLRDRNKPQVRPSFQTQQVWFSSPGSPSKLKDMVDQCKDISDTCIPLFCLRAPSEAIQKCNKTESFMDAVLRSSDTSCEREAGHHVSSHRLRNDSRSDVARMKRCEKMGSHCDKKWGDIKYVNNSKTSMYPHAIVDRVKSSFDLSEEHNNKKQAVCDKITSLLVSDNGDNYRCLSCVTQTQSSQTKDGNESRCIGRISSPLAGTPGSPRLRFRSRRGETSIPPAPAPPRQCVPCVPCVPSASERARFRQSFDSAASMVFHTRTGLPLTSSPAPVRRGTSRFDYDSSLNSVSAIRSALFDTPSNVISLDDSLSISGDDAESEGGARSPCSPDAGIAFPVLGPCLSLAPCSSLLGSFEESVLNGRLEPVSTVQGFAAELGASGSFCPRHLQLPVTVFFYTLGDYDKVSTPYLGHINLGKKGYYVPRSGTIQVTLFNPMGTVVKMFVVMYDLTDMPPNSHTFLRQRTLYMPVGTKVTDDLPDSDVAQKWLRYLIHLRFLSSKSGRIYLHTDIRMIIFRKSDMDTATAHNNFNNNHIDSGFELRSFTNGPGNPKFSPR